MPNIRIYASISRGFLNDEDTKNNIQSIFFNANIHRILLYEDTQFTKKCADTKRIYEIVRTDFPAILYANVHQTPIKIELSKSPGIIVYPLEPIRMKKGLASDEPALDLSYYIELTLQLCENFWIHDLHTEQY